VVEEAGVPEENHRPWGSNWSISSILFGSKFKFLVVKFGPNPVMFRLHVHSCLKLLKINKTCLRNLNKTNKHILELKKINTIPHLVPGQLDCCLCNRESTTIWTPQTYVYREIVFSSSCRG
jgi:hypothetical protein